MTNFKEHFSLAVFITLYSVVLCFESVDKILPSDRAVESLSPVYYAVKSGSSFQFCGWSSKVCILKEVKATELYFRIVVFSVQTKMVLTSVKECG